MEDNHSRTYGYDVYVWSKYNYKGSLLVS